MITLEEGSSTLLDAGSSTFGLFRMCMIDSCSSSFSILSPEVPANFTWLLDRGKPQKGMRVDFAMHDVRAAGAGSDLVNAYVTASGCRNVGSFARRPFRVLASLLDMTARGGRLTGTVSEPRVGVANGKAPHARDLFSV